MAYRPVWVNASSPECLVRAVAFVADRTSHRYAGRLPSRDRPLHRPGLWGDRAERQLSARDVEALHRERHKGPDAVSTAGARRPRRSHEASRDEPGPSALTVDLVRRACTRSRRRRSRSGFEHLGGVLIAKQRSALSPRPLSSIRSDATLLPIADHWNSARMAPFIIYQCLTGGESWISVPVAPPHFRNRSVRSQPSRPRRSRRPRRRSLRTGRGCRGPGPNGWPGRRGRAPRRPRHPSSPAGGRTCGR